MGIWDETMPLYVDISAAVHAKAGLSRYADSLAKALLQQARKALAAKDPQWAAQLADHLIALDPRAGEHKLIKADALEALAEQLLTATGRNYYLTVAQELRAAAAKSDHP